MKVIFLNIWKGIRFDPLMTFITESAKETEFFCFQEVFNSPLIIKTSGGDRSNIFTEISSALPDFIGYYAPAQDNYFNEGLVDHDITSGNALFVHKKIQVDSQGDIFIHRERNAVQPEAIYATFPNNLQYIRFRKKEKQFTLANVHGTSYPGLKLDTLARIEQSQKIISFLMREKGEKILGGDFNLMPETKSIRMIEASGMRNLIKEFDIKNTRNELALGLYPKEKQQYFADYIFVSPYVQIKDFQVPSLFVSDHLPLILDFE